eukprot:gene53244-23218_t
MREEYGWLPEAKAVEAAQAAAAQFGGLPGATFIHPTDEGALHIPASVAALETLKAAAYWSPFWLLQLLMGPKHVSRNVPAMWCGGSTLFLIATPLIVVSPI